MKIAFIGAGKVGAPLADHLANAGHEVVLAQSNDESASLALALERNAKLSASPLKQAVQEADVVIIAIPFSAIEPLLGPIEADLAGKVLVDCTNPVGPSLTHGLNNTTSGAAFIQAIVPHAKVVKAFTIYGFENLENPVYPYPVKPAMFYCGDDAGAKAIVAKLIADVGFDPLDTGGLVQALHLEHMTLLWVRMVRAGGHSPNLVWAKAIVAKLIADVGFDPLDTGGLVQALHLEHKIGRAH